MTRAALLPARLDPIELQPMDEKPPNSIKPEIQKLLDSYKPQPISEVPLKPRTAYSTHPRVQKAFRRILNYRKAQELQEQQAKNQSQKNAN
jgi:hypothetical protein